MSTWQLILRSIERWKNGDKALIPHDKDHAGDPWSFVPIFHSESNQIEIFQQREERHLKKRNESSKQHDEDHHASNLSLIILDEHKNIFDKHGSAVSPEG
jgi:hypothetical protein